MKMTIQECFRPALSTVHGHVDYQEFREQLEHIDHILCAGFEHDAVMRECRMWADSRAKEGHAQNLGGIRRHYQTGRLALRCGILRSLCSLDFREMSLRLADSELSQWFVGCRDIDGVRPPSKSSLERYDKWFPEEVITGLIEDMLKRFKDDEKFAQDMGLEQAIEIEAVFADSTCVKANIHFPVDWVLLRDAVRTLILAIKLIRAQGLTHRMPDPDSFLRTVNNLSIEMANCRRRPDSKKRRKKILRQLKKLNKTVGKHAERYRTMLRENWEQTDWSLAQAQQVIDRIDGVLDQLPAAIRQAHERIIGERMVANKDKIFSLYDPDIHVLVRGKADAEIEFGNGLYLAEQQDGLIVDWDFFQDQPPSDSQLVKVSVERLIKRLGHVPAYCTDRGFDSRRNDRFLEDNNIFNAICPKNVKQLEDRMKDETFRQFQSRRGQTEGRIGIFKNQFLGRPMRSKGFAHRNNSVLWSILTHNLWVVARMIRKAVDARKANAA